MCKKLTVAYSSMAPTPMSQIHAAALWIDAIVSVPAVVMTEFTASSTAANPLCSTICSWGTVAVCKFAAEAAVADPVWTGSPLGSRENRLSIVNGSTKRSATSPHSIQHTHFGAFLRANRSSTTASTSQPAVMLMFNTFRKHELICRSPFDTLRSCE